MSVYKALVNTTRDVATLLARGSITSLPTALKLRAKEIAVRRGWIEMPDSEFLGPFKVRFTEYATLKSLFREIFERRPYHFRSESKAPVIFDLGSNIGMATLYFKSLFPGARITAVEADPRVFALLRTNVVENSLDHVTLVNMAADDHEGTLTWHFDAANPGSLSMSSLDREHLPHSINVPCFPISSLVHGPVDFMKIDVEGAEDKVLRDLASAQKLSQIRRMVIEYHSWCKTPFEELLELLRSQGFGLTVTEDHAESVKIVSATGRGVAA